MKQSALHENASHSLDVSRYIISNVQEKVDFEITLRKLEKKKTGWVIGQCFDGINSSISTALAIPDKTLKIAKITEKTNRLAADAHMKDSIKTNAKYDNIITPCSSQQ